MRRALVEHVAAETARATLGEVRDAIPTTEHDIDDELRSTLAEALDHA
jgi:hypothetical protein